MMKSYKIVDNKAQLCDGKIVPEGFIPYTVGEEPQELIDAINYKTPEELAKEIDNAIQAHLDAKAREYRYDSMTSARAYAGYTNAFQAEATALASWASDCWVYAGAMEQEVMLGNRTMPTAEEAVIELPAYVEPA